MRGRHGVSEGLLNEAEENAMTVRDIMTKSPASCTRDSSLQDVARLMVEHDCGAIPVVAGGGQKNKPIGVVTDRDITVRLVARGQNPLEKTAGDAMTESTITIRENGSIEQCAQLMEEHQVRRLIVINDDGNIVGICAQADLARHADEELTGEVVEDVSQPSQRRN